MVIDLATPAVMIAMLLTGLSPEGGPIYAQQPGHVETTLGECMELAYEANWLHGETDYFMICTIVPTESQV